MIHSLYNVTGKGWLKALSFLLASAMFALILLKSATFSHTFGGAVPYLALSVFYAMAILWIHGIGFELQSTLFKLIFMPFIGYLIIIPTMIYIVLS